MGCEVDLLIIGSGPAGLSAAINAASEGLSVRVIEAGEIGGQAKESNAIENYAGFPEGVTGSELIRRLVKQCNKFGVKFVSPCSIQRLLPSNGQTLATTDDYQEHSARVILLAQGVQYRRLQADGIGEAIGRGAYYGMPLSVMPAKSKTCKVAVIGGANSAGQAALKLAQNKKIEVNLIIRKSLKAQMSKYLVERIEATGNIKVCENCEIIAVHSEKGRLKGVRIRESLHPMSITEFNRDFDYIFLFIGGVPKTVWLPDLIKLDKKGFIITEQTFQTSMNGVFAIGDVRAESAKRIAAAVGEGASVVPHIHSYLALNN